MPTVKEKADQETMTIGVRRNNAAKGIRQISRASIEARILAAAESVFAETGFSGATTAEIAKRAGVPKANLHYYFKTKTDLYRQVLQGILELWLGTGDLIKPESDPAEALNHYIAAKIELAQQRPLASRVFANEIIHGAPEIGDFLQEELRDWVDRKARVIDGWIAAGKMRQIDPRHLFFMIWANTQTYADFAVQIAAVLGRETLAPEDYQLAARQVSEIILTGCGLNAQA
ncbi:MAG TPA: TetR/AcrR family transcriptional regulator [Terriglobales bacterium]|nr:TetR/AcrR family transcriptional regulator [Terriglobales bacterium]